jgi:hypothetical protein
MSRSSSGSCGKVRSCCCESTPHGVHLEQGNSAASPLTGKLFDESGQSLTPSHAVKGERRYRYYVSRNLINRTKESGLGGWRLPAQEIERTVASAAYTMLSDQAVIANAALAIGLAEHQLPTLFSLPQTG